MGFSKEQVKTIYKKGISEYPNETYGLPGRPGNFWLEVVRVKSGYLVIKKYLQNYYKGAEVLDKVLITNLGQVYRDYKLVSTVDFQELLRN
jgi:hypothetical protein